MDTLRNLTASAAVEIRSATGPGPHTQALANYFNSLITGIVSTKSVAFDHRRWTKIVEKMDANGPHSGENLLLWVSALGGQISLLLIAQQKQVPREHLETSVLAFCDAVEKVGD